MTQQDVYNLLKKNQKKWFSAREVNEKLKFGCAAENLRSLFKSCCVFKKQVKGEDGHYRNMFRFRK